jgi:hypothetical protein
MGFPLVSIGRFVRQSLHHPDCMGV